MQQPPKVFSFVLDKNIKWCIIVSVQPLKLKGMTVMKKIIALLLSAVMLTLLFVPFVGSSETTEKRLVTDKTVYEYNEPITVTATGSGKDWVGIYYPGEKSSLYWSYIDAAADKGVGSGVSFDIKNAPNKKGSAPATLPAGEYIIRLMPNDTSDLSLAVETVNITIKPDPDAAVNTSGGELSRLNVPKTEYNYTEPITVSAIGSGKDWIGIYYPNAAHSLYWTYIDTTESGGVGSGVEFDIKNAANRNSSAPDELPAGKYIIRLMPNNSENIADTVAWVEVTVKAPEEGEIKLPEKPVSVEYKLDSETDGYSAGTLTVKVAENGQEKDVICYWAKDNGPLADYTALAKFKITGETTVKRIPDNTLIPSGATKLLVYTAAANGVMSKECFEVALPAGAASKPLGEPLFEFQVVSDVHINASEGHRNNKQYQKLLSDIVKLSPKSIGLFISGDIANSGALAEWKAFQSLNESVAGAPNCYIAIGNHDLFNGSYSVKLDQFLKYAFLPDGTNPESCHYDFWLDGYHYVFIGNDASPVNNDRTTLKAETLKWLDETLAKDRDKTRPTFVFLHQSIYDTVAGSLPGQGWDGVMSYQKLADVLKKYPEVIMFNGHSHWELDSDSTMYKRSDSLPTIFNTASVAYLWTSYDVITGENLDGSQGYFVKVYDDKVVVLGRDLVKDKWVSSAQFVVEYEKAEYTVTFDNQGVGAAIDPVKVEAGKTVTLPTPTAEEVTFEGWYIDPDCKTSFDPNTPSTEDIVLYANWVYVSSIPDIITPQTTVAPTEKGCGGFAGIAAFAVAILATLGTALIKKK